jgi:hypothetical protein
MVATVDSILSYRVRLRLSRTAGRFVPLRQQPDDGVEKKPGVLVKQTSAHTGRSFVPSGDRCLAADPECQHDDYFSASRIKIQRRHSLC